MHFALQIVVQMQLQMHFSQHKLKTYCQARDALQHATKNSQKEQGRAAEGRGVASGGRGGRVRIRWQGGGSLHLRPGTGQSDQHQHSLSNCCASLPVLAYASCLRLPLLPLLSLLPLPPPLPVGCVRYLSHAADEMVVVEMSCLNKFSS